MPGLDAHTGFILTSYLITIVVVVGLFVWVMLDHRAQVRALADLEQRGISRRSQAQKPGDAA